MAAGSRGTTLRSFNGVQDGRFRMNGFLGAGGTTARGRTRVLPLVVCVLAIMASWWLLAGVAQAAPSNTAPPTITPTTPQAGGTALTASPGTWTPSATGDTISYLYQWAVGGIKVRDEQCDQYLRPNGSGHRQDHHRLGDRVRRRWSKCCRAVGGDLGRHRGPGPGQHHGASDHATDSPGRANADG